MHELTVYDAHELVGGSNCPACNSEDIHCVEYCDDDDLYTMQCDNDECKYAWLTVDETETWK
jgi:hypothetical protein